MARKVPQPLDFEALMAYAARILSSRAQTIAELREKLRRRAARRVAPAVAKKAAETAYRAVDEIALIENFLARKYRGKNLGALLAEEKHLASAYRKLRTAGFSFGNSIRVLKRYAAEAERLEDM